MHQPTTVARPSIYYKYKVFNPWLPSEEQVQTRQKVVVVGAGPAGMVTALELARHGVASIILADELQFSQGSRAICFTRRSMEILQQVGVAKKMTECGLPWRFGNSYYRGKQVFRMEAAHDKNDRFFPIINVQQQYMEEYLYEQCTANPLIDFRWGNKLLKIEQKTGFATLFIDTPKGTYSLDSDWVVAADGGRSAIRSAMKLEMEGTSYEGFFVIADIKVDLPLPTERLAFFDPDWNPGNTILMHREPKGIWRIDYQLPIGESPEDALKPESLRTRIDAQLKMIGFPGAKWELDWSSVYSARTLTLPSFVHSSVIFTGDAAHLLPIFGVRGANTAFQDAQALGWQLAYVVKNLASSKLLENYSSERVGAAREIINEAGKSTRFMTPPTRGFRVLRDAVLSLSLTQEFVRPLYHWRTSRPHEYTNSILNCSGDDNNLFKSGPANGAPPKNVRLSADEFLLDHLGGSFDFMYFTSSGGIPGDILALMKSVRAEGFPIKIIAIGSNARVEGVDLVLSDELSQIRECYGITTDGGAYLFRPDQHICARWITVDTTRLSSALKKALPK